MADDSGCFGIIVFLLIIVGLGYLIIHFIGFILAFIGYLLITVLPGKRLVRVLSETRFGRIAKRTLALMSLTSLTISFAFGIALPTDPGMAYFLGCLLFIVLIVNLSLIVLFSLRRAKKSILQGELKGLSHKLNNEKIKQKEVQEKHDGLTRELAECLSLIEKNEREKSELRRSLETKKEAGRAFLNLDRNIVLAMNHFKKEWQTKTLEEINKELSKLGRPEEQNVGQSGELSPKLRILCLESEIIGREIKQKDTFLTEYNGRKIKLHAEMDKPENDPLIARVRIEEINSRIITLESRLSNVPVYLD